MADQNRPRRRELLAEIRRVGEITTGQAHRFYRTDLQYYVRRGVLGERGPNTGRTYTLAGGAR